MEMVPTWFRLPGEDRSVFTPPANLSSHPSISHPSISCSPPTVRNRLFACRVRRNRVTCQYPSLASVRPDPPAGLLTLATQSPRPQEALAMLTVLGRPQKLCDGVSRRSFLKIGAFAFGATQFTLADVLRAEESLGRTSQKAVINIFLGGGPPHQDMWEIKTDAPSEIRGEFKPINTSVPGLRIGECFPKIAALADKFAFIRSMVGARGGHDAIQCTLGRDEQAFKAMGGWPSMGSLLSKLYGPVDPSVPPLVVLPPPTPPPPS